MLGNPNAPVTMQEFADLQCPGCDQYMTTAFPDIVRQYVRTGKVKVEWKGIAFIGPDSEKGLRFVNAAGQQDKLWNVAELIYRNQGTENSGWVTNELPALGRRRRPRARRRQGRAATRTARRSTAQMAGRGQPLLDLRVQPDARRSRSARRAARSKPFTPSAYSVNAFAPTFDKYIQQSKQ